MNIEETYVGIVTGQLTLSAAMAIAQIECPLTDEEKEWMSKELLVTMANSMFQTIGS